MGVIALEGIEFFAYHGYYKEERKIGNKYEVNIEVTTDLAQAAQYDTLSGTINYEKLYKIIQEEMLVPSKMLEHVGQRIINRVIEYFVEAQSVRIEISKYNPPVKGVCHKAKVTMVQAR